MIKLTFFVSPCGYSLLEMDVVIVQATVTDMAQSSGTAFYIQNKVLHTIFVQVCF